MPEQDRSPSNGQPPPEHGRPWREPHAGCGWGLHREQDWTELDDWDRMSVTTDCVLFTVIDRQLAVLLYRRVNEPDADTWALPGVFVGFPETGEAAARRALETKCSVSFGGRLEPLHWEWDPKRDERGWVGTCVYLALARSDEIEQQIVGHDRVALAEVRPPRSGDPLEVSIAGVRRVPLAFDHHKLITLGLLRLRANLRQTGALLELMPERFTLRQLQDAYEAADAPISRTTFRRLVLETHHLIEPTGEPPGPRLAELYRPARSISDR